jgi:hypothetical protein
MRSQRPIGLGVAAVAMLLAAAVPIFATSASISDSAPLEAEGVQARNRTPTMNQVVETVAGLTPPISSESEVSSETVNEDGTATPDAADKPPPPLRDDVRAVPGLPNQVLSKPEAAEASAPPPVVRASQPAAPPAELHPESQPLANLSPEAAAFVAVLPNTLSIAAIDLRRDLAFVYNGGAYFDLASLAKVLLMLALLEEQNQERRDRSEWERVLLKSMIQWSNNQSADEVWERVGGQARARELLDDLHLSPGIVFAGDGWGDMEGEAMAVARLFREIVGGTVLPDVVRDGAMELLDRVTSGQRWGITAGAPTAAASVGLKNGWYPKDSGWLVHSAGYVLDASGRPDYVLAILSGEHDTLEDGIKTVESIAIALHRAMRGDVDPTAFHSAASASRRP